MIPVTIALVDDSHTIRTYQLAALAGALNEQIQQDFAPHWHGYAARATVLPVDEPAPYTWAVRLRADIAQPGALGYHSDDYGQPYALVDVDAEPWDQTCVTVSHEVLEMLADPWGSRLHSARVPLGVTPMEVGLAGHHTSVHYLVEACDPCERSAYNVQGVLVSDFITPDWYRTSVRSNHAAAYLGDLGQREVGPGGYVSFAVGAEWWQAFADAFGHLQLRSLGTFDRSKHGSLRAFTDAAAREHRAATGV